MPTLAPDLVLVGGKLELDRAVEVEGERILAVRPLTEADRQDPAVEILRGRALLPGFVNAHSHAFQRGLRGYVQHADGPDSFWSWRERMYALATSLTPDSLYEVSALAFREMLRAGFTTVGEFHYLQHQPDGTPYADPDTLAWAVVEAARDAGLRIVLLRVAYARAGYGLDANPRQARFLDRDPGAVLAAVARLSAGGVPTGLAPHSTRACPAAWLRAFRDFAGIVHAHVDEQPAEIEASLAEHGTRPLHVFADAGLLHDRFTAVHLTHPAPSELDALHDSGARVCACPSTELDLGDGFLPAEQVRAPTALGTDSHALVDPFFEMRAVEWHARARLGRRNVLPHQGADGLAAALLDMATLHGARSLGLDSGEIAAGKLADLVALDVTPEIYSNARLLPAIVFNGRTADVTDAWVGGRRRLRAGALVSA
jgi:formimidoylglutamate deiminase